MQLYYISSEKFFIVNPISDYIIIETLIKKIYKFNKSNEDKNAYKQNSCIQFFEAMPSAASLLYFCSKASIKLLYCDASSSSSTYSVIPSKSEPMPICSIPPSSIILSTCFNRSSIVTLPSPINGGQNTILTIPPLSISWLI